MPFMEKVDRAKPGEEITTDDLAKSLGVGVDQLEVGLHHLTSLGCFTSTPRNTVVTGEAPHNPLPTVVGSCEFTRRPNWRFRCCKHADIDL